MALGEIGDSRAIAAVTAALKDAGSERADGPRRWRWPS